jgi:hypothetical protein
MRFSFKFRFYHCTTAPVGQGLIIENSRSHTDPPHSVGLLWTSDQPDEETATWQHTTLTGNRNPCPGGIRTRNPSKRVAAEPHLRPWGHWDWLSFKSANTSSGYHRQYKKNCLNIRWEGKQRFIVAKLNRLGEMVTILVCLAAQDISTSISTSISRCWGRYREL